MTIRTNDPTQLRADSRKPVAPASGYLPAVGQPAAQGSAELAQHDATRVAYTVGSYLAARLSQIGLKHHFVVAGDYTLVLLDQLLTNPDMQQVYCSNELNCGFSAEGYARAHGAAAAVVTFSVGALSAFDAIGGAYAENLPVILISGAPNTNDRATEHLLHHTLGTHDFSYQLEMARKITCAAVSITSAAEAPAQIDHAIRSALREKKPAYIEIACNLSAAPCAAPGPVSEILRQDPSDPQTLSAAVEAAAAFLAHAAKPVMLIGSKLRAAGAEREAVALAEALGCGVAVMAAAKSFFPEDHPQYIGTYWGEISDPGTQPIVDWADRVICLGTVFNDYSTVGWTAEPSGATVLLADPNGVSFAGHQFGRIHLRDFLSGLAVKVRKVDATMVEFARLRTPPVAEPAAAPELKLVRAELVRQLRPMVTANTTVLAEGRPFRDRDAVGAHRLVGARCLRVCRRRPRSTGHRPGRRRRLPADGPGGGADDPPEAAGDHFPDEQPWLHDRGRDPRRAVQQRQELGLRRDHQSVQCRGWSWSWTARNQRCGTRRRDQGGPRQS
jgi:indolepyruvate decarboxylase